MLRLWKRDQSPSQTPHEDKFLDRYELVFSWALELTQNRQQAEDLTQDAFLDFTRSKPDLSQIRNLDAFLYQSVRNLHRSQLHRHLRRQQLLNSAFDYDSVTEGLRVIDQAYLFQVWEELRRVCRFVCEEKKSSKFASTFILRFFHGYMLSEAARVAKLSAKTIDKQHRVLRAEVRLYLANPSKLQGIDGRMPAVVVEARASVGAPNSSESFLCELRQTIYASCHGACFSIAKIKQLYAADSSELPDHGVLAHIVSCWRCLDLVNRALGIPLLEERTGGSDDRQAPGSDSPLGTGGRSGQRQASTVASPGQIKKWKRRGDAIDECQPQKLIILVDGLPRASMSVHPGHNDVDVNLDDAGDGPLFIEIFSEQDVRLLSLYVTNPPPDGAFQQEHELRLSDNRLLGLSVRFGTLSPTIHISYDVPETDAIEETHEPISEKSASRKITTFSRLVPASFPSIWERTIWLLTWRGWSAVASGILIVCLVLYQTEFTTVSASALLTKSAAWESSALRNSSQAIHQVFTLEERSRGREVIASRRRVEVWRNPQHNKKLSRVYDEHGVTLGSSSEPLPIRPTPENVWQFEPESGNYHRLVPRLQDAKVQARSDRYEIEAPAASLTLDRASYRPVAETIVFGEREFHFEEIAVGTLLETGTPLADTISSTNTFGLGKPAVAPPGPRQFDLDEAELRARVALHEISADLGEPIEVQSGPQGAASVSVVGIVPSAERKQELLAALRGIPHVTAQLETEEEAARRKLHAPVTRAEPEIVTVHSPIEKELLLHFGDPLAVENFSKHALAVTEDLMVHASALHRLSDRYPAPGAEGELALSPSSRQMLQKMRRDHLRAMSGATSELTTSLRPVLQSIVAAPPEPTEKLSVVASAQEVQRLTLALLSVSGAPEVDESSDPAKAAQALLAALRGLEIALEEQQ
jgi:DNA-directed RNA polymerase specialized sigma24 family protein